MAPHPLVHLATRTIANATVSAISASTKNETDATVPPSGTLNLFTNLWKPPIGTTRIFEIMGWHLLTFLILWNIPYLGRLLDPYKLLVVVFHEFSHAFVGKCTGAKIESIEVTPDQGGATRLRGGNACLILPAGYIGSSVIGSALIFCSFNVLACKIASCIVALSMILTMWWARDHAFTRWLTLFWLASLVYEWIVFADYGPQFYVISAGVMSVTYSLWDMVEDLIRRRVNHSDAAIFAKRYGRTPQFWGVFWFFFSLLILAGTITTAIFVWY